MFATAASSQVTSTAGRGRHRVSVAREQGSTDATAEVVPRRPTASEAIAALHAAVDVMGQVDWTGEDDEAVNDAAVAMQRIVNRVTAASLWPVAVMQQRESYGHDGAVTAASWLRNRVNMDPAPAARLCTAARRLRHLPRLREAFYDGEVSLAHVTAVTEATIPARRDAICANEDTLVELARAAKPRSVHAALRVIRDHADPDGADAPAPPDDSGAGDHDSRRFWQHHRTLDGLFAGQYLVGETLGEMLSLLFDAFGKPDPGEMALTSRRTAPQRRVDAMRIALKALLDAGLAPTVQGNKAHLLLMIDLLTLMGRDQAAVFASELRRTGRVSPATVARLGLDAKVTPVLTMGRWRVVAVGRTHRTLPPFLRPMLEMLHRRCRGPDCDRPACWTEAHHEDPYAAGGQTDLNKTIPLCPAHHGLVTHRGWSVSLDLDTGICTWTSPQGQVIHTRP